jgi:uncharacterized membrane protein
MVLPGTMGVLLSAPRAMATEWKICNASSESASVAIVFALNDTRQYISKGWWTIPPRGGCKVVFNGSFPVKGAYLRGEDQMHVIDKANFTTTLRGSQPASHGFGNDNVGVPVRE